MLTLLRFANIIIIKSMTVKLISLELFILIAASVVTCSICRTQVGSFAYHRRIDLRERSGLTEHGCYNW